MSLSECRAKLSSNTASNAFNNNKADIYEVSLSNKVHEDAENLQAIAQRAQEMKSSVTFMAMNAPKENAFVPTVMGK